ncbi:rhodanese-like domain-containing protein [Granulicatella seriolae]|uniref:Rhodanese-like domain-containing protein n=1 Tax=Granulicatella seriolae TaxID=2967226 RepID=A0ABT1WLA8_9LACT|nr:rhodanese-like domain-containing protein [Granulicatella seriolae]
MFSSIGVDEFYQKFKKESLTIIDVRETDEFEREHIPSARTLPLSELEQRIDQLNKDEKYYVICQSGGRSAMACNLLSTKGYDTVNVMGGMSAWKGELA